MVLYRWVLQESGIILENGWYSILEGFDWLMGQKDEDQPFPLSCRSGSFYLDDEMHEKSATILCNIYDRLFTVR